MGRSKKRPQKKARTKLVVSRDPRVFELRFRDRIGQTPIEWVATKMESGSPLSSVKYLFEITAAAIAQKNNCEAQSFECYYSQLMRSVEEDERPVCGRYQFTTGSDDMSSAIVDMLDRRYPGEYKTGEIFPGDAAPAVINDGGRIVAVPAIFGFPGYQDGKLLINARSETAAQKPTFSESLRERRIVLPASGFFEWSRDAKKTKYLFTVGGENLIYLCGVYKIIDGKHRFVILTRDANASMIETHDRMPIIIGREEVRAYLTERETAMALIDSASPLLERTPA